jgi:hypothetical protein
MACMGGKRRWSRGGRADPRAVRQPTVDLRARLATPARAVRCPKRDLFCDGVRVSWLPCLARSGGRRKGQKWRRSITRQIRQGVFPVT